MTHWRDTMASVISLAFVGYGGNSNYKDWGIHLVVAEWYWCIQKRKWQAQFSQLATQGQVWKQEGSLVTGQTCWRPGLETNCKSRELQIQLNLSPSKSSTQSGKEWAPSKRSKGRDFQLGTVKNIELPDSSEPSGPGKEAHYPLWEDCRPHCTAWRPCRGLNWGKCFVRSYTSSSKSHPFLPPSECLL